MLASSAVRFAALRNRLHVACIWQWFVPMSTCCVPVSHQAKPEGAATSLSHGVQCAVTQSNLVYVPARLQSMSDSICLLNFCTLVRRAGPRHIQTAEVISRCPVMSTIGCISASCNMQIAPACSTSIPLGSLCSSQAKSLLQRAPVSLLNPLNPHPPSLLGLVPPSVLPSVLPANPYHRTTLRRNRWQLARSPCRSSTHSCGRWVVVPWLQRRKPQVRYSLPLHWSS